MHAATNINCNHNFLQRQSVSPPSITCDISQEGKTYYNDARSDTVWICKSKEWIPYK